MTDFGRTWWGQQWLQSLNRIDFSNRLDRGKRYAKNNSIKSINIRGNLIEAKVQGSQLKPYSISIVVPPFFEKEKEVFISAISNNSLLLSKLFNRELPEELLQIGENNKIKIFPHSWQDIKLNCSCPDWAVPCKHLAAVIYTIANEIDQNPFIVFKLHNFDIAVELSKMKIDIGSLEKEKIFTLNDCIETSSVKRKKNNQESKREIPDFSTIENLLPSLPNLFPAASLFFSNNFKEIIQNSYKRTSKAEQADLTNKKKSETSVHSELRYDEFNFTINNKNRFELIVNNSNKKSEIDFNDFLILLAQTESKHLENYSDSFVAFYRVFRFCNILVERGAYLPRLMHDNNDIYQMLWIPALFNESVNNIFNKLIFWMPENSVSVKANRQILKNKIKNSNKDFLLVRKEESLQLLCSLFITNSIRNYYHQNLLPKKYSSTDQKVMQLFFSGTSQEFSGFSEKEIPNSIQLWLQRFYVTDRNFSPLLQVYEMEEGGFQVEVLVKINDRSIGNIESLDSFMQNNKHDNKLQVMKTLNSLSEYYPDLNKIIESNGKENLFYKSQKFSDVLIRILPALNLFGIKALLPKSLQNLIRPKVSLSLSTNKKNTKYFSLNELISYDWQIAIGENHISPKEFLKLSKSTSGLVWIRDQYVMMTEEDVSKIIRQLEKPEVLSKNQLLQAALSADYETAFVKIDDKLRKQLKEITSEDKINLPSGLNATLRPYQQRGFNWIYKNSKLGLGSLLADDMGLGKTLQVITALLKFKEEGMLEKKPALVIVPTTLITNWLNEINRFAPGLRTHLFHGSGRTFTTKNVDVIITTFGIARTENETFCKQSWHVMVVDEAQNIKNPEITQTKLIKKIKANIKIAMSGTPVENRLNEYWSIFDFANPDYLGNVNWFNSEYGKPIEINQDQHKLTKFKLITSPFIMRRVKTDKSIINDLPDKVENNQYCSLTKEQAALYQNLTHDLLEMVESAEGINRRGLILKLLLVLKQVCNHPAQYLKNDNHIPELSGKMMMLLQLLETIYENNEKVLIFSQYREMGEILRKIIYNHFGKKALQLHGGNSRKERDEMVDAFQNSKQADTFILSIKAGGTGLNLTAAANVIHYDLWWNPAVESQATDRAFRIGQKQNVMVHRMITKGTLEEKIDEMIKSKKKLANLTVANGEKWIGDLSDKELMNLVALGS
jgi:SNF2 family DNA or RNA helicase/uncharacterized Zn finger protein